MCQIFDDTLFARMGDHFALMGDRLITEATLQVAIERMKSTESTCVIDVEPSVKEQGESNCGEMSVQCRICHDEDLVCEMDAPCSCIGSLKYVHPRCVLRWCQEKGNTNCEICLKQFRGYIINRRIVLHMRDSIIRTNFEMQQRSVSRRIATYNYTERNPANYSNQHSKSEKLMLCFLLAIFLVPLKIFVAALGSFLLIFFIAVPALQRLYQQQETADPTLEAGFNV
ncbi:RING/FYVE/PHD zinc finger superfamily protein [Rhynchospora pubera]|uniref:RING/FYVE/PHD zinc finger superfamily protein n=1 Tax=Rhynchospora pubera TaxID=906938 RepID=A0AAV8C1E4_9POAL|nr:RING/FYVE/PHD zinc finger superfamily protein [Rhynchospora pubera]